MKPLKRINKKEELYYVDDYNTITDWALTLSWLGLCLCLGLSWLVFGFGL